MKKFIILSIALLLSNLSLELKASEVETPAISLLLAKGARCYGVSASCKSNSCTMNYNYLYTTCD